MPRYFPDLPTFTERARGADIIPVYRQLLSDWLTPVSAFEVLSRDMQHAFLLESVVGGEKIARYSFIATQPSIVYSCTKGQAQLSRPVDGTSATPFPTTDPLADLTHLMSWTRLRYFHDRALPPFTGGLVGFAGYDTVRYYESEKLTAAPPDDRNLPDLMFGMYGELVVFDHVDKTIKVISNARIDATDSTDAQREKSVTEAYHAACARVDAIVRRLSAPVTPRGGEIDPSTPLDLDFTSNMSRAEYEAAVACGMEYIKAGDIFQFVPSQRFRVKSDAPPFDVYRALRVINPSPFMFYLKCPACTLIGASPEILCRVQDGIVTSRPLAGTRKRGATEEEDKALEAELLADPKERAEHIMLVDLHRNDIGRVSKIGSVKVVEALTIERYSHVMHISSDVQGELAPDQTAMDALRVSLPVGTVSGAPKIRAMQIIDEVERTRRGPYGGAVGYFDFAGNMDMCIALRTIVWTQGTDGHGCFDVQAGAGVVADSVPASEYEETMSKARALLKAVEIAHRGM